MRIRGQEWVTVFEASSAVKVPATTVRDWYRSGAIDSMRMQDGSRMVALAEVETYAAGEGKHHLHDADRKPKRTPEQLAHETELETSLKNAVTELQGIARDRKDPPRGKRKN